MDASKILVDTSVLIDYSKGFGEILGKLLEAQVQGKVRLLINSVVVAEFMTDQHLRDRQRLGKSVEFMEMFQMVESGREEGMIAGDLLRNGECLATADALIAATCLHHGLPLLTRNTKHFIRVKGLKFYGVEKKRGE